MKTAEKKEKIAPTKSRGKRKYKRALVDPQQIAFLAHYNDPQSPTFGNALQSALKAGYTQQYANNITAQNPKWLDEAITDRSKLLEQAEKNLKKIASMNPEEDKEKLKAVLDVSKFLSERLGRQHYSTRSESVNVNITVSKEEKEAASKALDAIL